jgi:GTP cyclohydrolase FolE2
MKKLPRLRQPENYTFSEREMQNIGEFGALLNHLTNVVASEPLHPIGIDNLGVTNQKAMISIASMETPQTYVPVLCEISTGTNLRENRGIHMSRCIQSIFTLAERTFPTLDDFALALAQMVREKQESETAFADVTGTYIHKRYTRKTHLASFDNLQLISKASVSANSTRLITGMKVYNATACPCTKTYTKYSIVPELQTMGLTHDQINRIVEIAIAGTHMQRGTTSLQVDKENSAISHRDLFAILEKSVHLVNELLKRPDEHDLVVRTLSKPQFTEDVVREVAYNAYQHLKDILPPTADVYIESLLQDSIHIHDVRSVIRKPLGEIKNELEA